jgi:hypothetical protein
LQFKDSLNRQKISNDWRWSKSGATKKQALDKRFRPFIEFFLAPAWYMVRHILLPNAIHAAYLLFLLLLRILGGLVYGLVVFSEMGG